MMIFATPDFGTGAYLALILLIVWVVVLALVVFGILRGARLLNNGAAKDRKYGILLIVMSGLIPLLCCLGPPEVVRIVYGNYPIGQYPSNIREGMSADEVLATLGSPHERFQENDGEHWYYWIDSFGIHWACVDFGSDGRVSHTHGN
jgi:hypothetical protein